MNKHTSTRIFINSINMQIECIYIQKVRGKEGYFIYIVPRVKQFCDVKFGTLFVCYYI